MPHLEEGTIHAWLDGALSDAESADVAKHASECAECGALVAEARGFIAGASRIVAALDVVPGNVIPAASGRGARPPVQSSVWGRLRLTPARAAIAATLLVAVGSLLTVRGSQDKSFMVMQPTAASAPAATPALDTVSSVKKVVAGGVAGAREIAATRPASAPADAKPDAPSAKVAAQSTTSANRLADAVVGAAPPARAPVPSAAPLQGPPVAAVAAEARRVDTAARTRARFDALAGRGGGVNRLESVVTTSGFAAAAARDAAATVCYALTGPVPSWAAVVPQRFALDGMRASDTSVSRFVVRRVTAEGKTDGPIVGSWWQRVDTLSSVVRWTRGSATPITLTLTLDAASRGLTATLRDSSRVESVGASVAACSP